MNATGVTKRSMTRRFYTDGILSLLQTLIIHDRWQCQLVSLARDIVTNVSLMSFDGSLRWVSLSLPVVIVTCIFKLLFKE